MIATSIAAVRTVLRQPRFPGLLATNFVLGLAYSFVLPFMSMWGTLHVGMSPSVFGLFMTATSLSAIVLSMVLASWSDTHVSRRTMLVLGSLGGAIGYLGYAFVREVWLLTIIGCVALGIATVNFSQLFAHVREEFEQSPGGQRDAAFLMSVLRVFFSLAWTVGPALGAWVMVQFQYRGVFAAAAGLFLLFLAGVLWFVPHRPHSEQSRRAPRPSLWRVLSRGDILVYFTAFVLVFAAHTMSLMNLPLLVTQSLGGTEADVGIIFGIAPVIEVPLMLWFGRLASSGHQIFLIRLGVLASVAYFVVLTFAQAPWHIYPMQVLTAVSIAITTNITILFFQDLLPQQAGVATSIYSNSFSAGSLVGYLGFGLLVQRVGHRGVFLVCAALSAVAFLIVLLRRYRPRETFRPAAPLNAPIGG
ncbi:MAG TPA: sugar efflux transporter [Candidatus Synoicihabitans sp.]|nr:sugar efflux transporter [Candidatus Synoicihabitans sp.]